MDGSLEISIDKLPLKRLDSIEENGVERFPTDVGYDEKRVSLIRRIDFAWAVEKDNEEEKKKKQKSSKEGSSQTSWPWQSMVENLKLANQELSVIIDLINTVEANNDVTVAGMNRPKLLPHEVLAELAISTATKLQCYRQLGKYFKQSAKALEQQVVREAKFYGALIRLQQNWKVKRQRVAAIAPGSEGFTIDLFDSSLYESPIAYRPSSLSTIRIEHDSAGMLAINVPPNSCRFLHFGFLGTHPNNTRKKSSKIRTRSTVDPQHKESEKECLGDNECVKETHQLLREVHQAIFDELVFDAINREAFSQSLGVNVTGIRENYLQLSTGPGTSIFVSLIPPNTDADEEKAAVDGEKLQSLETDALPLESFDVVLEENFEGPTKKSGLPNCSSYEIYLKQIFHEHLFSRSRDKLPTALTRVASQLAKDTPSLLGHFCMSMAHRIFANKVLMKLESVVCRVPYIHLISHPTWSSRASSWTISMKVPSSVLRGSSQSQVTDAQSMKNVMKSEFRTKVAVNDDCIKVEAECAPNLVGLFKGCSDSMYSTNKYDCDLADLPVIIVQQVASQVIRWLHEEALKVGIKAIRDFLCLRFELEQGEILSLVAHVDPEDMEGCISWWLVMEDGLAEERNLHIDATDSTSDYRRFLGYLPLDVLYSTLMDLVSLCSAAGTY